VGAQQAGTAHAARDGHLCLADGQHTQEGAEREMRQVKILTMALMAATALAVAFAGAASAASPEFNLAKGKFFADGLGEAVLQIKGGAAVKCKKYEIFLEEGVITGAKTLTAKLELFECTSLGLPTRSVGNFEGFIAMKVEGELCWINETTKDVGVFLTITPPAGVTLEVPGAKTNYVVKGNVIGLITPFKVATTEFKLKLAQVAGAQNVTECQNGGVVKKASLLTSTNGGAFTQSGVQSEYDLTYEGLANQEIL
jgi:hypothetical protein